MQHDRSFEHTKLLIPQLAGVNIDCPLHDCYSGPSKGQSREDDWNQGQAGWPADRDEIQPHAELLDQNRGGICEVEVRSKLCGFGCRYAEKIDRRLKAR